MRFGLLVLIAMACLTAACGYTRRPEERTDDGLVRVPSRASGGVYRAPGASFIQYRRLILEPPIVEFAPRWRDEHKEVTDREAARLRNDVVKLFREEFMRPLVEDGSFGLADEPGPDVLLVVPKVVDLDIPAPDAGNDIGMRTYTPGPPTMQITGELRDATTNALLGRVIMFEGERRYGNHEMRLANRVTNAHELRLAFGRWANLVEEAINVAKATRIE